MKASIILIISLIICATIFAQEYKSEKEEEEFYTKGSANGKFWEVLNVQEKIYFICGIEEGLALARNLIEDDSALKEMFITGVPYV